MAQQALSKQIMMLDSAAFSEKEIAELKAGKMWLTLTVGNQMTVPKKGDTKLPIEQMLTDRLKVKAVEVAKPRF